MLVAKVLQKGQIVIPKDVRERTHIRPGDKVKIKVTRQGIVILPLGRSQTESFAGMVKGKLSLEELDRLYAEKH